MVDHNVVMARVLCAGKKLQASLGLEHLHHSSLKRWDKSGNSLAHCPSMAEASHRHKVKSPATPMDSESLPFWVSRLPTSLNDIVGV